MFEKVQNSILFFLKNIQFTLRTWKNAIEIARAYDHVSKDMRAGSQRVLRKRAPAVAIAGLIIIAGAGTAGYLAVNVFHIIPVKKEVTKRSKKPKNEITKKPAATGKNMVQSGKEASKKTQLFQSVPPDTLRKIIKPEVKIFGIESVSDTNTYFILVANKAVKSLYVLQKQDTWRVIKEYDIAIGDQEGRKQTAGDRRTPEGSYFIVGRKERSELNIIYGPLAYVLNYPNEEDRREGRTGQGIWIHGTDPDSLPLETRGCLEMNNSDLVELSLLLKRGIGTPITIIYDEKMTDPVSVPDYSLLQERRGTILLDHEQKVSEFSTFVQKWKSAWEGKKIDEYEMYYDTSRFKAQGMTWTEWKERKLRTFGLYDTIAISIHNVLVTDVDENTSVIKFIQQYKTNVNSIENGKKLNLVKINDFWKITGESTCPKEELLL